MCFRELLKIFSRKMDETSTVTHFYFIISSDANSLRQPERCEKVEIGEDGSWYDDTTVQFFSGLNLNRSNFFRPPELPQKRDQHIIDFEWY